MWAVFGKSRGEGGHMKNPFRGWGMDIFWNHTMQQMMRALRGKLQNHVPHCSSSHNLVKRKSLVYFSCNLQHNFSLGDVLRRDGVTRAISSTTCLVTPLHCKLQKRLPCVTVPLREIFNNSETPFRLNVQVMG